jgi:hypothetical protein
MRKADEKSFGYIACMGLSTGMSRQIFLVSEISETSEISEI